MEQKEITCHISCQLCGWNTGVTILADEADMFEEILKLLNRCSAQHHGQGIRGKLLVAWEPVESATGEAEK